MSKSCTISGRLSFLGTAALLLLLLTTTGLAQSFWPGAIVARHYINFNGQNVQTDSFDSSSLYKSLYGKYDPSIAGDNGNVACNANIVGEISIGQGNIYGHVQTGPNGTATFGSGGGIGTHAWQAANGGGGLEPNTDPGGPWYTHDANVTFPYISLPYNSGLSPLTNQDVVTVTYNISSNNVVGASTYPYPPPWSGVTTNYYGPSNTVSSYPGPLPGLVTNTSVATTICPNYPAAGTYIGAVTTNITPNRTRSSSPTNCFVPGTVVKQGANFFYTSIDSYTFNKITGYRYPTNLSYNYALFITNAVYSTNHYDYVFGDGQYYFTGWFAGQVLVNGNCSLVLPNGLNMCCNDRITIASGVFGIGGGKLTLCVGGYGVTIGGNGIVNQNGYAEDFVMYCASTVNTLTFNGNGNFIGVICAPSADVTMNGSGKVAGDDFSGFIMANSIVMNGPFYFHYDESLASSGLFGAPLVAAVSSPSTSTDNSFRLTVHGALGRAYAVETSTNLIDWVRQTTNLVPFQFADDAPGNYRQRFFRTVLVP